ncbi:hypothetical protein AHAS_Ahas15G0238300 [Arachis hypogaea]
MTAVAPIEIHIFSDLVNKARVVEEYAKMVASSKETSGGNTSREHDDHLGPRGQNFKRNEHAPQHIRGQGDFRKNNNTQFHMAKGDGQCYTCGLPGHLAKDYRRGRNRGVGKSQQPGRVFALEAREATGSDPPTRGKRML